MTDVARAPEDLGRLIVDRLNRADVDGLVELYEPDAVLALPGGGVATGHDQIRAFYAELTAQAPKVEPGRPQPTLRHGDLALTSTRLQDGTVTAEIARRRPDGTWRWIVDSPAIAPPH